MHAFGAQSHAFGLPRKLSGLTLCHVRHMQRRRAYRLKRVVRTHVIASYAFAALGMSYLYIARPAGFAAAPDYKAAVTFLSAPLIVPVLAFYALTGLTVSIHAVVYIAVYASLWALVFVVIRRRETRRENV